LSAKNDYSSFILVRFSEIAIKGTKTRKWLTKRLVSHIDYVLNLYEITDHKVINDYSRIFVETSQLVNAGNIICKLIPGVSSLSIVRSCSSDLDDIKKCVEEYFFENLKEEMSFAVRARRTGKHSYSSVELGGIIGEFILENNLQKTLKVNLDEPEYLLQIEVRDKQAYVYDNKTKGIGGLPVESQGRVLVIISNEEIDIPNVLQIYKRGGSTLIYSTKNREELNTDTHKLLQKMLALQPKLKNEEEKIFFPTEKFSISHLVDYYKKKDCLAITMSKAVFDEIADEIPTIIPIFVPHLVIDVDKKEIEDLLSIS
jgi:thiamine biosynthesis protein ThiI